MAIRNLNTIQNQNDFDFVQSSSKEYIVQALANLGQRVGIKGEGVEINNFTFSSIVDGNNYNPQKYIGYVKYDPNKELPFTLGIADKHNTSKEIKSISLTSPYSYIVTSDICKLSKIINNVDEYATRGIISVDDNFYTFAFTGVLKGNDFSNHSVEYICEKINKYKNIVESAIRIKEVYGALRLFYLVRSTDVSYNLKCYKIVGTKSIDDIVSIITNNIAPEFISPEAIITDTDIALNFDIIGERCEFHYEGIKYIEDTSAFEIDVVPQGCIFTLADLKTYLTYFSYDLDYLYRYTKEYYSEIVYKFDNLQFKKQIVVELTRMIFAADNYSVTDNNAYTVYFPLDYNFNYACNSESPWQIYYNTLDIITKYVLGDQIDKIVSECDNSAVITKTANCERVSMFNYNIDYDKENNSTVYEINAYKHYTLPYINGENYWVLDDIDSNIYAKGINAGNPNIILIKTKASADNDCVKPEILCTANKSIIDELVWKYEHVTVDRIKNINLNTQTTGSRYVVVKYAVPDIENSDVNKRDEYLHALDNAIIINMAGADCVIYDAATEAEYQYNKKEIEEEFGEDGVISTLWTLDTAEYQFRCVQLDNEEHTVVDFNYITNVNNLINYALNHHEPKHPDKYLHDWVVFKKANATFKNNENDEEYSIYPNIRNIESSEYNSNFIKNGDSVGKYYNNLNFVLRYSDIVKGADDNLIMNAPHQSENRYFNTAYNEGSEIRSDYVTNAFYTYSVLDERRFYNEYIPNYDVPTFDLSEVITRNQTLLNRLNIMSFNMFGTTYMSYIGTSHEYDKNKLVIGSSNLNINMGVDTLIDADKRNEFKLQDELHLEFPNTFVSSYAYVGKDLIVNGDTITYGVNWNRYDNPYNGITYWTTQYIPKGRYIYENKDRYNANSTSNATVQKYAYTGIVKLAGVNDIVENNSYISYMSSSNFYQYAVKNNKLFAISTVKEEYSDGSHSMGEYNIYLGDSIYIPVLLNSLGISNFNKENSPIDLSNIEITTNMQLFSYQIQYDNDEDENGIIDSDEKIIKNYPLLLQTSSLNLTKNNLYNYITEYDDFADSHYSEEISDFTYGVFKGNELDITYYYIENKLHMDIVETTTDNIIQYPEQLKENYLY